jgi:hypothetical protein
MKTAYCTWRGRRNPTPTRISDTRDGAPRRSGKMLAPACRMVQREGGRLLEGAPRRT